MTCLNQCGFLEVHYGALEVLLPRQKKKKLLSFSAVQCSVVFILPLEVSLQCEMFCKVPSTKNGTCITFFICKSIYCHTLSLNEENYYVKVIVVVYFCVFCIQSPVNS